MFKKITALLWVFIGTGLAWAQPIDLNKASEIELDGLAGVGPALTREVLRERDKAPFQDWADVTRRVRGIGPQKASRLSEQGVRVQGQAFASQRATPSPQVRP
jgi:competence protein ComEA